MIESLSVKPEMGDFGSSQGRSDFETDGVAVVAKRRAALLRRGFQKSANAGLGRKMPFMVRN